jgi:hypothetical protein
MITMGTPEPVPVLTLIRQQWRSIPSSSHGHINCPKLNGEHQTDLEPALKWVKAKVDGRNIKVFKTMMATLLSRKELALLHCRWKDEIDRVHHRPFEWIG